MLTKIEYFRLANKMDTKFLIDCLEFPTVYMTKTHLKIIRLVLRKRGVSR